MATKNPNWALGDTFAKNNYAKSPNKYPGNCARGVQTIVSKSFSRGYVGHGNGFWCWTRYKNDGWGVIYKGWAQNGSDPVGFQVGDIVCMLTQNHINWMNKYDSVGSNKFKDTQNLFNASVVGSYAGAGKGAAYSGVKHCFGHIAIKMASGWYSDTLQTTHGPNAWCCYSAKKIAIVILRWGASSVNQLANFNSSSLVKKEAELVSGAAVNAKTSEYDFGLPEVDTNAIVMQTNSLVHAATFTTALGSDPHEMEDENGVVSTIESLDPKDIVGDVVRPGGSMTIIDMSAQSPVLDTLTFLASGEIPFPKMYCPICGKEMSVLMPTGICSAECAKKKMQDVLVGAFIPNMSLNTKYVAKIKNVMQMINFATNLLLQIPHIVEDLARIPDVYRNFVIQKVNIAFTYLQIFINKMLIWKNELLIRMLEPMANGNVLDKVMNGVFAAISAIKTSIDVMNKGFDVAYAAAYKAITTGMVMFAIQPHGLGYFMTSRSAINFPGKMFVEIPNAANLELSAFDSVNMDSIRALCKLSFPPIQKAEYFLEPEIFNIRLILSDQNYKAILDLVKPFWELMKMGAEFLPKYEELLPKNPFYVMALLLAIEPINKQTFGFPSMP